MPDSFHIIDEYGAVEFSDTELVTGYNPLTGMHEVIVKYNGDILRVGRELGVDVEILSENYAIITLEIIQIPRLFSFSEIEHIETPRTLTFSMRQGMSQSCILSAQSPLGYNLSGEGVIVAVLDSGIDYRHPDFRNEDGSTRILSIWDQTAATGTPPAGFSHGAEYTADQINEALDGNFSIVPEADTVGHGTAVAGVAAGNGRASNGQQRGAAPKASLLIVKLGMRGHPSFARTTEMMRAIKYVIDNARELQMPIAINISFGTNDGSHSGDSLFETYIDEMSLKWKTSIIVAAGNEGAAGHHYFGQMQPRETRDVTFFCSSGFSSFYLTLWKSFVDNFTVELILPDRRSTGVIRNTDRFKTSRIGDTSIFIYYGQPRHYSEDHEIFFQIKSQSGNVPLGVWTLRISAVSTVSGVFNIWLPTVGEVSAATSFSTPDEDTTITIPSTARMVATAGGYDTRTDAVANFSGRGFTRAWHYPKPDLAAPAVNVLTTSTGGYSLMSGTSIAAPFITGSAALMMQWGIIRRNDPFLYGERIKAFLKDGATRNRNIPFPNNVWGFGALCLENTMRRLDLYAHNNFPLPIPLPSIAEALPAAATVIESIPELPETAPPRQVDLSLNEFLRRPDVVDFNVFFTPAMEAYVAQRPFIKLGTLLANETAILYTTEEHIDDIFRDLGFDFINVFPEIYGLLDRQALDSAGITWVQQSYLGLTGRGVLTGFIDTGIDYTQQVFKYENGTSKIRYIWDQTLEGTPPDDIRFGAVYNQQQLNEALASDNPFSVVPTRDTVGHGTYLASIAAGRETGNFIGAAPDSEIIAVKLRKARPYYLEKFMVPPEQQNAFQSTDTMLAIKFIINRAQELNRPVVICIALGSNFGGHDGSNQLENYITFLSGVPGIVFCTASGNEGGARHHTSGRLENNGDTGVIDVRVGQGARNFGVYIWYAGWDRISFSIRSPTGERINRIPFEIGLLYQRRLVLERASVTVFYHQNKSRFAIIQVRDATPGTWEITLHGDVIITGEYHAWLPITGFISPEVEFASPSPYNTIVIPSTAFGAITIGSYNSRNNSLSLSDSWGPTLTPRMAPDFVAPGVNVGGIYPTGPGVMSGTSVAAAVTAGACALMLEWGIVDGNEVTINGNRMRTLLIRGCTRDDGVDYPNVRWGYGRLNLMRTFRLLRDE